MRVLQFLARQRRRPQHADHTRRGRGRGTSGGSAARIGAKGPGRSSADDSEVTVSTVKVHDDPLITRHDCLGLNAPYRRHL